MPSSRVPALGASAAIAAAVAAGAAAAQSVYPPPSNVVSLNASATVEVPRDLLTVVFSTNKEGTDAAAVQSQLKQAVDAALAEARKVAKPGQVDVQTGNFSLYPRYNPKGALSGWQGSAELIVEGRDMPAIAQLTGKIQSLTIARVAYGLSREAREKVEADVTAQAIAKFRTRAEGVAKQFGFSGWSIREVSVTSNEPGPGPVPMMRAQAMRAEAADAALPVEAGKATVTATVAGSIQMAVK